MSTYSRNSKNALAQCRVELRLVFTAVLRNGYDHAVVVGHRVQAAQHAAFISRVSKVDWPDSKHNSLPSNAVDARPYIPGLGYPTELKYFYRFAGQVEATARHMGYLLRWGGDWDSDQNMDDQTFHDLFHYEYVGPL